MEWSGEQIFTHDFENLVFILPVVKVQMMTGHLTEIRFRFKHCIAFIHNERVLLRNNFFFTIFLVISY